MGPPCPSVSVDVHSVLLIQVYSDAAMSWLEVLCFDTSCPAFILIKMICLLTSENVQIDYCVCPNPKV